MQEIAFFVISTLSKLIPYKSPSNTDTNKKINKRKMITMRKTKTSQTWKKQIISYLCFQQNDAVWRRRPHDGQLLARKLQSSSQTQFQLSCKTTWTRLMWRWWTTILYRGAMGLKLSIATNWASCTLFNTTMDESHLLRFHAIRWMVWAWNIAAREACLGCDLKKLYYILSFKMF